MSLYLLVQMAYIFVLIGHITFKLGRLPFKAFFPAALMDIHLLQFYQKQKNVEGPIKIPVT